MSNEETFLQKEFMKLVEFGSTDNGLILFSLIFLFLGVIVFIFEFKKESTKK